MITALLLLQIYYFKKIISELINIIISIYYSGLYDFHLSYNAKTAKLLI